eukprot:jgi/Bigna1/72783/fgenesh1_pg.21_\
MGGCCSRNSLVGFFCSTSLGTLDHLLWFDHRYQFNFYMVEALTAEGAELKAHVMRMLEIHIVAFALVFGALAGFLVDMDPAENKFEVLLHFLTATVSIVAFCGAGLAMSGYNILGGVSDENVPLLLQCNIGYVIMGMVLYSNVHEANMENAGFIAVGLYLAFTYIIANAMGFYINSMSRIALYSGSLGGSSAPCALKREPLCIEDGISEILRMSYENKDPELLKDLYLRIIKESKKNFRKLDPTISKFLGSQTVNASTAKGELSGANSYESTIDTKEINHLKPKRTSFEIMAARGTGLCRGGKTTGKTSASKKHGLALRTPAISHH